LASRLSLDGSRQAQETLELASVKPHHDFAVDDRHGRGEIPKPLKLLPGFRIFADVLDRERNSFLRKKLFLSVATPSPRLGVDDDFPGHQLLLTLLALGLSPLNRTS
jgi:hypothetical protein